VWTCREVRALREGTADECAPVRGALGSSSDRMISKWEAPGSRVVPRPVNQVRAGHFTQDGQRGGSGPVRPVRRWPDPSRRGRPGPAASDTLSATRSTAKAHDPHRVRPVPGRSTPPPNRSGCLRTTSTSTRRTSGDYVRLTGAYRPSGSARSVARRQSTRTPSPTLPVHLPWLDAPRLRRLGLESRCLPWSSGSGRPPATRV